ncbi:MAG: hypothetical protein J6033_04905 [Lachnospiraceae bacterium]|nr:hypothetical protein [Lachnospiraceae bacterium]
MSISFTPKNDYSFLFKSMNKSSGNSFSGLTGLLSEYNSIKSGNYGKLMKAYYNTKTSDEVKSLASDKTVNKDSKALAKVSTYADSLKDAADDLLEADYDKVSKDELYSLASKYVEKYNSVVNSSKDVTQSSIVARSNNLSANTSSYSKKLSAIGITADDKGNLSIDEKAFKDADTSKVKDLFGTTGSYGYSASAQASLIGFSAENAMTVQGLYNSNGNAFSTDTTGSLFNTFF